MPLTWQALTGLGLLVASQTKAFLLSPGTQDFRVLSHDCIWYVR